MLRRGGTCVNAADFAVCTDRDPTKQANAHRRRFARGSFAGSEPVESRFCETNPIFEIKSTARYRADRLDYANTGGGHPPLGRLMTPKALRGAIAERRTEAQPCKKVLSRYLEFCVARDILCASTQAIARDPN